MKKLLSFVMCVLIAMGSNVLGVCAYTDSGNIEIKLKIVEDTNLYDGLLIEGHAEIKAYKGGKLLWERNTEKVMFNNETETISDVYVNSNTAYIVISGTLHAINIENGNTKWTVQNCGIGNCFEFDGYGNIYISGSYGPDIVVIDKNGNELYREDNPDYGWVNNLKIVGNTLNINYSMGDGFLKTLNISQFKPNEINVLLNGEKIEFDQQPVIQNGRTLVPIRAVVEKMGGNVEWNELTRTAMLEFEDKTVKLTIDSTVACLDEQEKTLDVAPQIINGRTLMPIRFVAESFGFDVSWNASSQSVIIVTKKSEHNSFDLLDCIGKTKKEIVKVYGEIVAAEYWLGGKYYKHNALESLLFYDHDNYGDESDDVSPNVRCNHIIAMLSEWLNTPDKEAYTITELENIFGKCEFIDDLNNDDFPYCYYRFAYGDYLITVESDHINPRISEVVVSRNAD